MFNLSRSFMKKLLVLLLMFSFSSFAQIFEEGLVMKLRIDTPIDLEECLSRFVRGDYGTYCHVTDTDNLNTKNYDILSELSSVVILNAGLCQLRIEYSNSSTKNIRIDFKSLNALQRGWDDTRIPPNTQESCLKVASSQGRLMAVREYLAVKK
jgi:hypothetical protein